MSNLFDVDCTTEGSFLGVVALELKGEVISGGRERTESV